MMSRIETHDKGTAVGTARYQHRPQTVSNSVVGRHDNSKQLRN